MKRYVVLALLVMLTFVFAGPASATADVESIEIAGTMANPCTGEDVYFSGTVHITRVFNESETGNTLTVINLNYADVIGVGVSTGNHYKYVGHINQVVSQDSDFAPLASTVQERIRWVTAGGDNDLNITIFQHLTWNANGEVTAYSYEFGDPTCS